MNLHYKTFKLNHTLTIKPIREGAQNYTIQITKENRLARNFKTLYHIHRLTDKLRKIDINKIFLPDTKTKKINSKQTLLKDSNKKATE